jgi:hypothetical protein
MTVLLGVAALAGTALADDAGPVKLETSPKAISLKPGATGVVRILVRIEAPFHIYATGSQMGPGGSGPTPTDVDVKTKDVVAVDGGLKTSAPNKHFDPNFGMDISTLEGSAWIDVPVKAVANLKPGKHAVVLVVSYQACNDSNCLLPQDAEVSFDVDTPSS